MEKWDLPCEARLRLIISCCAHSHSVVSVLTCHRRTDRRSRATARVALASLAP
jgi:hypothetical protein